MKNEKSLISVIVMFAVVVGLNSCSKEQAVTTPKVEITKISDYTNILSSFALESDELVSTEESNLKSASVTNCFTVTIDKNENGAFYPRKWTVDYLGGDCVSFNGNTKKGKINVSLTDFWKNEGSLRTVTFEDYFFNDNKITGTKTILNTGLNERGNLTFFKTVSDASIIYTDGTSISWECKKFSEMIAGNSTFIFADDVYSVNGTGTGINLDKQNYTMKITSPLIYKNGCFYPVSGIIEITTDGAEKQTIDYGSGECDTKATLTVGGVSSVIEL